MKKKIKDNAFKFFNSKFTGKVGADYARSMIAPQDKEMYDWLNEKIRVGRFGTKQMTQFFDYALENPTPQFFRYVLSKFLRHFGVNAWDIQMKFDPGSYESYLQNEAAVAEDKLKVETNEIIRRQHKKTIKDWETFRDDMKRYQRFCECFLHDEDWSVEQELEIGRVRNEHIKEFTRYENIKYYHELLPTVDDQEKDTWFCDPEFAQQYNEWEKEAPKHFISLLQQKQKVETTKRLLDEAEGRVSFRASGWDQENIYYERKTK